MDRSHTRPLEFTFTPHPPLRAYEWTFKTPNPAEIDVETMGSLEQTVSKTEQAMRREIAEEGDLREGELKEGD